jgi:hypothetical protein
MTTRRWVCSVAVVGALLVGCADDGGSNAARPRSATSTTRAGTDPGVGPPSNPSDVVGGDEPGPGSTTSTTVGRRRPRQEPDEHVPDERPPVTDPPVRVRATRLDAAPTVLRIRPTELGALVNGLRAVLTTSDGDPLPHEVVRFTIGGQAYCSATTDASGTASCTGPDLPVALLQSLEYQARFDPRGDLAGADADGPILK